MKRIRAALRAAPSLDDELGDSRNRRVTANEAGVDAVHTRQPPLRILFEHSQPGRTPPASQVNAQSTVGSDGVPHPVRTSTVLDDDEDPPVVVEEADRDAAPLARAPSDVFLV
jgi:hypothetical protein